MMSALISFVRQFSEELIRAADEMDASPAHDVRAGDVVRVVAMAMVTASKKTLLA